MEQEQDSITGAGAVEPLPENDPIAPEKDELTRAKAESVSLKQEAETLRADLQTLRAQNDANRQTTALVKTLQEERALLEAAQQQQDVLVDEGGTPATPEGEMPPPATEGGEGQPEYQTRRVNGRLRKVRVS
jgi:hypothetical protein